VNNLREPTSLIPERAEAGRPLVLATGIESGALID
jgi:hypothetical protein